MQKARLSYRICPTMPPFHSAREAKEFLVAQISEEAQREGVSLSDVERKMLYFSETAWTLPDMTEVSDKFDEEYDQDQYEKKIAKLIRSAIKRARKESPEINKGWLDAVQRLKREDHYILVMIRRAGVSLRPPHDLLKLWGTGFAIVALGAYLSILTAKYNVNLDRFKPRQDAIYFAIWATAAAVTIIYWTLRLLLGKQRVDPVLKKITNNIFRIPDKKK